MPYFLRCYSIITSSFKRLLLILLFLPSQSLPGVSTQHQHPSGPKCCSGDHHNFLIEYLPEQKGDNVANHFYVGVELVFREKVQSEEGEKLCASI